ncbi:MAG: GyrI-like domain-containing protein [Odoribacter sp.]|nr:GyrI-like domain-containing protein [Odoribacter sp.]
MNTQNEQYRPQIDAILHHINLMIQHDWSSELSDSFNQQCSINKLSELSAISKRNLHIIFKSYTGEHLHKYINRLRLEYAWGMLRSGNYTNQKIAEHIGFANVTAFYNTFKKHFGQTPAQAKQASLPLRTIPSNPKHSFNLAYSIREINEKPLLFLPRIGNYELANTSAFEADTWDTLYQYATSHDLLPDEEEYWGICYDDTLVTNPDKCRFYACLSINTPVKSRLTSYIKSMTLPRQLYAVYCHKGNYTLLDTFYDAILKNLPPNYLLGEGFILERYLNSPTDTPADELLTEVWLPIKSLK